MEGSAGRQWYNVQDFHLNFWVYFTWFFAFFCSLLDYIVLVCFLKISSPCTSKMTKLSFVVKTEDDTINDTRDVDPHRRLRGI